MLHASSKAIRHGEVLNLCVLRDFERDKLCSTVPRPTPNAVYVVTVVNEKDLGCDDSGQYGNHATHKFHYKLEGDTATKSTEDSRGHGQYMIKKRYSSKKARKGPQVVLERSSYRVIWTVFEKTMERHSVVKGGNEVMEYIDRLLPTAVIQYVGFMDSLSIKPSRPHGNVKSPAESDPYIRVKSHVGEQIRLAGQKSSPKLIYHSINKEAEDKEEAGLPTAPSDKVRDLQQVYYHRRSLPDKVKLRNTGRVKNIEFDKLLAMAGSTEREFLRHVGLSVNKETNKIQPETFAATQFGLKAIKKYCQPTSKNKQVLHIDATFNVGPYFLVICTLRYPMIVKKTDPEVPIFIIGAMATMLGQTYKDYLYFAQKLQEWTQVTALIYGTDGENALERAMMQVFPTSDIFKEHTSIKLRCFTHFRDNMRRWMESKHYDAEQIKLIIDEILGKEVHGKRHCALVDMKIKNFDEMYDKAAASWPKDFADHMEAQYLKPLSNRNTLKWNMSWEVRQLAGLGNPPKKFCNNDAEMANNELKDGLQRQKVDQVTLHELALKNVIEPNEAEVKRAIYNTGNYRLAPNMRHLSVEPNDWANMSTNQKAAKIKHLLQDDPKNLEAMEDTERAKEVTHILSVQPEELPEQLANLPNHVIEMLWSRSETILSKYQVKQLEGGDYSVEEHSRTRMVTMKGNQYHCECPYATSYSICEHMMCVAEACDHLRAFLSKYKYNVNKAISHSPPSAGRKKRGKGRGRRGLPNPKAMTLTDVEPYRPQEPEVRRNLNLVKPYQLDEVYQNEEPFVVTFVDKLPEKQGRKNCKSCECDIPKESPPPFDIACVHKERWTFFNRETKEQEKSRALSPMFYHARRECILRRHPHFHNGFFSFPNETMQRFSDSHFKLFEAEFDLVV